MEQLFNIDFKKISTASKKEAIERKKNLVALTPYYIIISLKTTRCLQGV